MIVLTCSGSSCMISFGYASVPTISINAIWSMAPDIFERLSPKASR